VASVHLTDGITTDCNYQDGNGCYYASAGNDTHPKVTITLETDVSISQVKVWNRCNDAVSEDLTGFQVKAGHVVCGSIESTAACTAATVACDGITADSVTIEKAGGKAYIAEIEVFGTEADTDEGEQAY